MAAGAFADGMTRLMPALLHGLMRNERSRVTAGTLTVPQTWAIMLIGERGACPMRELAASVGLTRATVTHLADRLTDMGLVARRPDAHDRRMVLATLTVAGHRALQGLLKERRATVTRLFGRLSATERGVFLRLLSKALTTAREDEP